MTIRFSCPTCNKTLAVPDAKAGVKVACPACKGPFRVPMSGQAGSGDGTAATATAAVASAVATAAPTTDRPTRTLASLNEWGKVDDVLGDAVEVLDRPLTAEEEAQVRASLTAYANSVPHHDLQALGKQVKITKVREFRVHRVVLDSLFEKRHAIRKEESFQGGDVPPAAITEANIRVWSFPYATATEFQSGTKENAVGDSKAVRACQKCGGQRAVACGGCSGGGAVSCRSCGGAGSSQCGRCGGTGRIKEIVGSNQKQKTCSYCDGKGLDYTGCRKCGSCDGRGIAFYDDPIYQIVPCHCENGLVACSTCHGRRLIRCPKCRGSGKLSCTPCKATGRMLSYLALVQSFEPTSQTITVPSAAIKDQRISGMLQQSDYTPLLTLATTDIPDAVKLSNGVEKVRAAITKAFDAAHARVSDENRLTRQRLQIGVASVLEVAYQHQSESYTAWFVGKQFRLHAPVNPVTDALRQKLKEAVKKWRKGDQKDAVLVLNEVTEMANADPCCNAAYEEVRDTIPTDLGSKLKWHRLRPKLIVGAIVGGVWLLLVVLMIGFALIRSKSRHNQPGGVPPFVGVEQPGGQPPTLRPQAGGGRIAVVQFLDRNVAVPKGGKATVRFRVQRVGQVEGDLTLKLEAPRGLTLPPQVVLEQGRVEAEIEVTAGDEAGVYSIRAVPVDFNGGPLAAECRVTVGDAAGLPALPNR